MWQSEQWQRCPDCGTFEWEWEESETAWSAGIHLCPGCRSVDDLKAEMADNRPVHPEGYKLRLFRGKDDDGL